MLLPKFLAVVILLLLAGCSFSPINAPVDSRGMRGDTKTAPSPLRQEPAGSSRDYVVKRGDTLYSIAWQYGLNYRQLAAMNGVRPPYTIYAGQRLRVSQTTAASQAAPARTAPARTAPARTAPARTAPARTAPARTAPAKPVTAAAPPPVATTSPVTATRSNATPAEYNGKWAWPTRGRVLSGFNAKTPGKKGIQIEGHSGQPVKAAASGKVVYVGSGLVGYGRLIIIKHNDSLLSAYGHNSKLLVVEGEHVEIGQTIATMGSSGAERSTLYFEVRKDGKPVNPLYYLPKSG
jgi:lipoprotein NlpD